MAGAGNIQDIKKRVKSITGIEHITNAMKLVSVAKLRRARHTLDATRGYFHFVTESIEDIFASADEIPTKYLRKDKDEKSASPCYVVITSNRGLAGSFNTNVIKKAEAEMRAATGGASIVALGGKGRDYFKRHGYEVLGEHVRPPENISFAATHEITRPIIDLYDEGKVDEIVLIYTAFRSAVEQRVTALRLLPIDIEPDPEAQAIGKYVEYEPSVSEVFNYLVPKYVEVVIYQAIVESATCEHAARHIAMDNATNNAQQMISDLNLYYNRARQDAITRQIIEVVSGAEALE
ncbi:MAG: ATP synthase F1 subunit gamma [Clostridiales Family XIII bacterium]|jgi:F-type H+-transporting ATPase subunit gamma|nr:ATP synthase F1 subunit gamma [Clostridiales Family XIII bacterium]